MMITLMEGDILVLAHKIVSKAEGRTINLEEILPGISERLMWLDAPHLEISGTDLRRRVSEGLPIRYLIPPAVQAYIDRHSLYTAGGARPSRSHLAHANRGRLDHGAA